jgi:hypothetical protein
VRVDVADCPAVRCSDSGSFRQYDGIVLAFVVSLFFGLTYPIRNGKGAVRFAFDRVEIDAVQISNILGPRLSNAPDGGSKDVGVIPG